MTNPTTPDFTKAKSCYIHGIYYIIPLGFFSEYSPAYLISNEPLDWETSLTPKAQSVLTIAGSGDQALFYKLAGAKTVDTFDVSYCARIVQDIKTTAIKELPYEKYIELLCKLHPSDNATQITEMIPLLNKMPTDSLNFINEMRGYRLFDQGEKPYASPCASNICLQSDQYSKLRHCIPSNFNFIWSDVSNLHTKLTQTYDVINMSNVFDYMNSLEIEKTIYNLYPFLNDNGRIIFCGHHINYGPDNMAKRQFCLHKPHLFGKVTILQKTY